MLASADIPGWVAVERLGLPCPVRRPREGVALGAVTWCLSVVRLEGHQGTWEAERFLKMAFGGAPGGSVGGASDEILAQVGRRA